MKHLHLKRVDHSYKIGAQSNTIQPNVHDDCLLFDDGVIIGMFISDVEAYNPTLSKLLSYADTEFRSARVPKSLMERKQPMGKTEDGKNKYLVVKQYSTILGSIPKKPHMKRNYHSRSAVHLHASANKFIRAMLGISELAYELVKGYAPTVYEQHMAAIQRVDKKWMFGKHCTSNINNYNIAAAYHQDNANVRGTVNCILTKRADSTGGNLHVPDYDAVFDQKDNSLLVYPAWRNMHAVTPIVETKKGGYRNSMVYYTLKGFMEDAQHGSAEKD